MGQEAQEILDKTAKFTERLYDMTEEEIQEYLNSQGKDCNKILYIEYQYYQIGKTDEWLENMSAKIGDPLVVRREILLQRLHGSSASPYDQEDIEYIVETQHKPIDELWLLDFYKFDIYKKLNPRTPYIIGVDCSTGTGGDNNAITVIDPYTVEPVAEFECSYIGETMYEKLLIELINVLPRGILCIERNSVGDSIIDHLLNSPIRDRLYFDKNRDLVQEKAHENETVESMLKKQAAIKTYYGVWTGTQSRDDMFSILSRHVKEYKEKFIKKNIIRDLSRLIRKSSGKIEAGPGSKNVYNIKIYENKTQYAVIVRTGLNYSNCGDILFKSQLLTHINMRARGNSLGIVTILRIETIRSEASFEERSTTIERASMIEIL